MSPEGNSIFVFEVTKVDKDGLIGNLTRYDQADTGPLKWTWTDPKSNDYQSELGGLFYLEKGIEPVMTGGADRLDVIDGHKNRYQFTSSKLVLGHSWIGFIIVLPTGFTLTTPPPAPKITRAKKFNGRLACFWRIPSGEFGSEPIDFSIKEGKLNVKKVNKLFRLHKEQEGKGPLRFVRSPVFWGAVSAIAALIGAIAAFRE